MIVMLGGPTMNLIIYLVLTVFLLTAFGTPESTPTTTGGAGRQVRGAGQRDSEADQGLHADELAGRARRTARRRPDRGGQRDEDHVAGTSSRPIIEPAVGKPLHLTVLRNGHTIEKTVTPVRNVKYLNDTSTKTKDVGFVGIAPTTRYYYADKGILDVPGQIGHQIGFGLSALGRYPQKIESLWQTVFDGKPRDPQGAVGVVGIGRIGGQIADSHVLGIKDKAYTLISLLAGGESAAVLLQPAAAAAARRRSRGGRAGRGDQAGRAPAARRAGDPSADRSVRRSSSTPRRCCRSCTPLRPC